MQTFKESQFGYFPLVRMFPGSIVNNKANNFHERALQILYKDCTSSFEDLLKRDNFVTIHHRNIKSLATELF